jgi:hypothetical protein
VSGVTGAAAVVDYRSLLAREKCWDTRTEALLARHGEPLEDCILQNREELIALCEMIERKRVRSYLEIGIWTGRLLSALHRLFRFDLVAACDHRFAAHLGLTISVPPETRAFWGDSGSEEFRQFRRELGSVDLVLIDADHSHRGVWQDFVINRAFPHRFLAFHDICGARRSTQGVKRFWEALDQGYRLELVRPHRELGLEGSLMGIGVWSAGEDPAGPPPG